MDASTVRLVAPHLLAFAFPAYTLLFLLTGPHQGASTLRDEHSAAFQAVLEALRTTVDPDEIVALVRQAEEILADQAIIIPIYSRLDPGAVWADEIGGYVHSPSLAADVRHRFNVVGTMRLLDYCQKYEVKKVVVLTTAASNFLTLS